MAEDPRSLLPLPCYACWIGTDVAHPGMFDGRREHRPCGRRCNSDLAGFGDVRRHTEIWSIKTSRTQTPVALQASPGSVQATGVHVATVGPEACLVRSEAWQSVTQGRGEVAQPPPVRRVTGPPRCETEQAKGRHPYLVTATKEWCSSTGRETKVSEANLRVLAPVRVLCRGVLTCGKSGCAVRPCA